MIIAFHKPYGVLSQFTPDGSPNRTLTEFGFPKGVYAIGRLDADSEGLLLLSDEAGLNSRLLDPERGHSRCYWVQVERIPSDQALSKLAAGVVIQDYTTRPCRVWLLDPQPDISSRNPPIRIRKNISDCWIALQNPFRSDQIWSRRKAVQARPVSRSTADRCALFQLPST